MEKDQGMEQYNTSHVDWSFLPPTAMHVIGTVLPPSSLIKARLVNRHWASCLAALVDTLYIVPEYFLSDGTVAEVQRAFPKATTMNLDLQDTFMAVPVEVKESLDRYNSQRDAAALAMQAAERAGTSVAPSQAHQADDAMESGGASEDPSGAGVGAGAAESAAEPSGAPTAAAEAAAVASETVCDMSLRQYATYKLGLITSSRPPGPPTQAQQQINALAVAFARDFFNAADTPASLRGNATADGTGALGAASANGNVAAATGVSTSDDATATAATAAAASESAAAAAAAPAPAAAAAAMDGVATAAAPGPSAPAAGGDGGVGGAVPAAPAPAVAPAAVAAAVAPAAAAAAAGGVAGGADAAAAAPVAAAAGAPAGPPPPPPTLPYSAISVEPLPGIVPTGVTHLRVRLPDSLDVLAHHADLPTSWDYVAALLGRVGRSLSALSLSTAPDAAHISMLSPLTQLTSLTMDEASHSTWSAEHLPIVGSLTELRNLAIKIPPFRSTRPDPPAAVPPPVALASWTALQQLTKLHVSAMRYSFHSSLMAVLPHLTKLEYLALRAPVTRLPWPGTDKPMFVNIATLTGLTQLSLALGDHNMAPQDWQALTTLTRLSAIELSVSEGSDGLNVPMGLEFPALRSLKLRYPNSQDLVRIAMWTGVQRLDIKFPEHEHEWHQEDAVVELLDLRTKLLPTAGAAVICYVVDNAPAAHPAPGGALDEVASTGPTGLAALMEQLQPPSASASATGAAGASGATAGSAGTQPGTTVADAALPPKGPGNTAGLTLWWSPLLPLLALPNMVDFRCSAKEGLSSRKAILFDEIVQGMCAAWTGVTRLCFKGCISVQSQTAGWDAFRALTKLQQLELRHHPAQEGEQPPDPTISRAARPRFVRVEPIKLPATSLPDSLQTLLLENVELRRKETDCLVNLNSLERRTTCRHFPEFVGMPLQRLVVSNCCVKAKGITSIASECAGLTHLVFAVYKVSEEADMRELQSALRQMVRSLTQLQVLKVRVLAGCITRDLVEDMVAYLPHLQRLKLTSSDGWADTALFLPLTRMAGLRKCSLAYFKGAEAARLLRAEFRTVLPYCKIKAKHEAG